MSAGPDIHGMINDQQFQGLPPRDQRRALYQLTNDSSFQGLSDADTMRFVGTMRTQTQSPTVTPPPVASVQAQPSSDPIGSTLKFLKGFGGTIGRAAIDPGMGQGGVAQQPLDLDTQAEIERIKKYGRIGALMHQPGDEPQPSSPSLGQKMSQGLASINPIQPSLDKPHDPESLGQSSANVAMLARALSIPKPIEASRIPTGDLAAKGKAVSKLLGQEALAKIPIAGRVVRRPSFMDYAEALAQKADPQMELFKNVPKLGDFPSAKADVETGLPKAEAKSVPENPTVAYRVRDAGETGIMPKGHAQAGLDMDTVSSYAEGRAQANNAAQELVKIDLTKLDSSEYSVHPNGYVTFKTAVPESYIEKIKVTTRNVTQAGNLQRSNLAKNQKQMAKYGIKVPEK